LRRIDTKDIFRVVDANANRLKEGLRVCEDISRFILNDTAATRQYKVIRHKLSSAVVSLCGSYASIVRVRNIEEDVGKKTTASEMRRKSVQDIFYANSQRIKESVRVLEEFAKLINEKTACDFKKLRYAIYALEKKIIRKL